ncbi:unnamed protein product [Lepeophtheirus salmonis]|uniref:(salmon louse) hypothetical protein n=1 Tax=Lepeophtheirus salmonis TaxID=72036 RepID=A0A7R8CKC3_LEPSM|nr:unnamed protein product [Lepeophtheirus salmonis]CAF2847800.1 unnamed protein product [Lepeophtheirus salmonis]
MKVLIALSALLSAALSAPQGYGAPHAVHAATPHHGASSYEQPAHYAYNYGVVDDYSGNNFGQSESRDGYATTVEHLTMELQDTLLLTVLDIMELVMQLQAMVLMDTCVAAAHAVGYGTHGVTHGIGGHAVHGSGHHSASHGHALHGLGHF